MTLQPREDMNPSYPGGRVLDADDDIDGQGVEVVYRADCPKSLRFQLEAGSDLKWRPSLFMPRWASRITLEITDVRVERVKDISTHDCVAEGITTDILPACGDHPDLLCYVSVPDDNHAYVTAQEAFQKLWDDTNGKGAWERNDWVWALMFKRVTNG